MKNVPTDLNYTETHEWVRLESDGIATIGITDYAQHMLGEMVFVELPELGNEVVQGDEMGLVESDKSTSDLFCPVNGEIVEVNENLSDSPVLVNQDPYGNGWICKLQLKDAEQVSELMDAETYAELIAEEE